MGACAMTAKAEIACTESYYDVEKLIFDIVHRFREKYGGDFEELMGEARKSYMVAYRTYNREKGAKFSTYVHWVVSKELLEYARRHAIRTARMPARVYADLAMIASKSSFDLKAFLEGLSEDASQVVKLVLDPPADIEFNLRSRGKTPRIYKSSLVEFLQDLGWVMPRILASFTEIQEALT